VTDPSEVGVFLAVAFRYGQRGSSASLGSPPVRHVDMAGLAEHESPQVRMQVLGEGVRDRSPRSGPRCPAARFHLANLQVVSVKTHGVDGDCRVRCAVSLYELC